MQNSAHRLNELFVQAKAIRTNEPTYIVWTKAFGLSGEGGDHVEDLGSKCMQAVREEIDLLRNELGAKECPEALYLESLDILRNVVSPSHFAAPWNQIVDRARPEDLVSLKWASWVLGDSESELSAEERKNLLKEIEGLLTAISRSDMPTLTKNLLIYHLTAVKEALWIYVAKGVEPLNSALHETLGSLSTRSAILKKDFEQSNPESKGLIQRTSEFVRRVVTAAENIQKLQKGFEASKKIAESVSSVLSQITG